MYEIKFISENCEYKKENFLLSDDNLYLIDQTGKNLLIHNITKEYYDVNYIDKYKKFVIR